MKEAIRIEHSAIVILIGVKYNKKATQKICIAFVPPTTHNLNEILAGTIDLARVWDLYGYLIK